LSRTVNLGILAHVDAGKTSLTERLLFAAGVIDRIGRVDDGTTQTDSLALERQRGITIKSAVVSFVIDDVTVNLIDTPGHPDFIAEVERVLSVLDGAVLVVSAVEGIQAQTRVLMRALQRLRIPTLIFVNKIDRRGAQYEGLLAGIRDKLSPAAVAMGRVTDLGTPGGDFVAFGPAEDDAGFTTAGLARQTGQALAHPIFFGSAITGAGLDPLMGGIRELLPATEGDPDGPVSGTVFKVERGRAGEKVAYVRMFSGTVRTRDRLRLSGDVEGKVTAISVFDRGSAVRRPCVVAGQIGRLWGLAPVRIGDPIGVSRTTSVQPHFAPPTLETVVVPSNRKGRGALHFALAQLAEQDPLINLRQDDVHQEIFVSLYGEVQKEVIQATLADEYGIEVTFRETTTICVERPVASGAALERIQQPGNPFAATLGLRIDPAPIDAGLDFRLEVELGSMPLAFFTAVEQSGREAARQGINGWAVTDCTVSVTHAGFAPPITTARDFRLLTPLVLAAALSRAGTKVCEPVHHFRLELPADALGPVSDVLARLRALPGAPAGDGSWYLLEGEIPAGRVHELQQRLPGLTRGEGVLEFAFARYQPVRGTSPRRPRSDHDPFNRKEYLLQVVRRTTGHQARA
jgi:ribosomal protection tetracycline resistance protein